MTTFAASPTADMTARVERPDASAIRSSGRCSPLSIRVTRDDLERTFRLKHGDLSRAGWVPRMHHAFGYFNPDDHYEALVAKLIGRTTRWLDVGCGRTVFPSHPRLARTLAHRCRELVGVDPSDTLDENPYVHRRIKRPIEAFKAAEPFDVVTLRMVAEHVERPHEATASLARATRPGSLVVVYTVHKWSPVSVISRVTPFALHHRFKNLTWRVSQRDTYPVVCRMNTRAHLGEAFRAAGFRERLFMVLDDCRASGRFRGLRYLELSLRGVLRRMGVRYPESCLLAVYERMGEVAGGAGPPCGC